MGLLILMAAIALDSGRLVRNVAQTSAALRRDYPRTRCACSISCGRIFTTRNGCPRDYLLEQEDSRAETHKEDWSTFARQYHRRRSMPTSGKAPDTEQDGISSFAGRRGILLELACAIARKLSRIK